jgi:probable addiction module antidote protein
MPAFYEGVGGRFKGEREEGRPDGLLCSRNARPRKALVGRAQATLKKKPEELASLAEKTKLNRESLYRMLSERGNPEFRSLDALLHALGFRLAVAMNR